MLRSIPLILLAALLIPPAQAQRPDQARTQPPAQAAAARAQAERARNPRLPRGLVAPFPAQKSDVPEEPPQFVQPARSVLQQRELETLAQDDPVVRALAPTERLITILGTNDIHGALETDAAGKGGMALWAGLVQAIRQGLEKSHGAQATVVLLDGGDQLQGTLISAKNEGFAMIRAMSLIGYDGIVPGNHDYDFGPVGFLNDQVFGQVDPRRPDADPRGVIRARAGEGKVTTPFLSANTFLTDGLFDTAGRRMAIVDPQGCRAADPRQRLDLVRSLHPQDSVRPADPRNPAESYVRPFRLLENRAGLTIAVIGLDTHETPTTTAPGNILDLCFADEADSYVAAVEKIRRFVAANPAVKAPEIFLVAAHAGDPRDGAAGFFREFITKVKQAQAPLHAIVGGHTHQANKVEVGDVHAIQSGANGTRFGRIDLIYDVDQKKVVQARSENFIEFSVNGCDPKAARYCQVRGGRLFYEGIEVERPGSPQRLSAVNQIETVVRQARAQSNADFIRTMGRTGPQEVKPDRIKENSLGNVVTDAMRAAFPGAQAAVQNMGGLRITLPANTTITFDHLFRMMPFNNHAKTGKVPARVWVEALGRAAKTCGAYPTLAFSGITAEYRRTCAPGAQTDERAVLISARAGTIDLMAPGAPDIDTVTADFLADGGDGYLMFREAAWVDTGKVLREELAALAAPPRNGVDWAKRIDGRWKNLVPGQE